MISQMLNQLLVLGQIPGTSFQLTFYDYLGLVGVIFCLGLLYWRRFIRLPNLRRQIYYLRLYFSIKRGQQLSLPV